MLARVTTVSTERIGSVLSADASSGETTLYVQDITPFGESGTLEIGTEQIGYTTYISDEEGVERLDLDAALANSYTADEEPVYLSPAAYAKVVTATDGEVELVLHADSGLWPQLQDGARDDGAGELIRVEGEGGRAVSLAGQQPGMYLYDESGVLRMRLDKNSLEFFDPNGVLQGTLDTEANMFKAIANIAANGFSIQADPGGSSDNATLTWRTNPSDGTIAELIPDHPDGVEKNLGNVSYPFSYGYIDRVILAEGSIISGTYTPTLANVANIAARTAYECQYLKVGNVVTVSGAIDVDPASTGVVRLGISLPIASSLTAAYQCAGAGSTQVVAGEPVAIVGDPTNNRAEMYWVAVDTGNRRRYFSFTYRVV